MGNFKKYIVGKFIPIILITIISKLIVSVIFGLSSGRIKDFKDFTIKIALVIWVCFFAFLFYKQLKKNAQLKSAGRIFTSLAVAFAISWVPELLFMKTSLFHRYVGVDYVYNCSSDDRDKEYREGNSRVYLLNSSQFEDAELEAHQAGDCFVQERNFLFWQTAFAQGYTPSAINSFSRPISFADYLELFFSASPLFCLENILKGLVYNLPFVFLWYLFFDFDNELIKNKPKVSTSKYL